MIKNNFKKKKIGSSNVFVEPDEIFLDSKNLENFDKQQFEGRIEKPISKKNILFLGFFFLFFILVFFIRLEYLQIKKGNAYFQRSENNTLTKILILADRGIIYDRAGKELAWNKREENFELKRIYLSPGFSHLIGYVTSPSKDKKGIYWQTEFEGKDGLEKQYNEILKGENGSKIIEIDALGQIHSENTINFPKRGKDLKTTIDASLQGKLFELIKRTAENNSFSGGAGIIIDATNGEILSLTSFPEYNSLILSDGKDSQIINNYFKDKRKVFMDRSISGLYAPGSIVKPFFAIGALNENLIDPNKEILSTGSISIPNPYDKNKETIFKDWKVHGWTAMREAIAVSSDVYFYTIGGGFEGQKGLGIYNLGKYAKLFKIGEKTGIDLPDEKNGTIPSPEWKTKNFPGDPWRVGNTYHTAIGQYGFQVTPIEMARAISMIANNGRIISPHLILNKEDLFKEEEKKDIEIIEGIKKEYFDIVKEGMREAVSYGTAVALNVPYVKVAAKTGTAQLGLSKNRVNSWIVGFFPYENPKYVFTIMMESGPASGGVGASSIMRELLDWMFINTPEYFKL